MMNDGSDCAHGLGNRILRAGIAVGIAHFVFKIAGLVQLKAMGHYLSPFTIEAVYVTAFEGCLFSLFLIGVFVGSFVLQFFVQVEKMLFLSVPSGSLWLFLLDSLQTFWAS